MSQQGYNQLRQQWVTDFGQFVQNLQPAAYQRRVEERWQQAQAAQARRAQAGAQGGPPGERKAQFPQFGSSAQGSQGAQGAQSSLFGPQSLSVRKPTAASVPRAASAFPSGFPPGFQSGALSAAQPQTEEIERGRAPEGKGGVAGSKGKKKGQAQGAQGAQGAFSRYNYGNPYVSHGSRSLGSQSMNSRRRANYGAYFDGYSGNSSYNSRSRNNSRNSSRMSAGRGRRDTQRMADYLDALDYLARANKRHYRY